jgi:hypothetical protein
VNKNALGLSRDIAVNQLLINSHLPTWGVTIYNIINTNPLEIAISILALKLGITNKIILGLIVAFLI